MNSKFKILGVLLSSLLIVGCSTKANDQSQSSEPSSSDVEPSSTDTSTDTSSSEEPEEEVEDFSDYEEVSQAGKMLFPTQSVGRGFIGDPMPYYENGVMYAFFLEDARNYSGAFHPISLLKTSNFMEYEEHVRVIPFVNNKNAVDYALGTGSCVKDKLGTYHFFYTGHNSNANTGLPYYEKIQHAISTDLINWTKLDDGFYGDTNDFRDPHVVYIEEANEYWMLVTQLKNALGQLHWYKSNNCYDWVDAGTYYTNTKGFYNMECSTLIHFKGYWYLSFNEQGQHRVMHYRYKKNLTDEWIVPEVDYLDDEGFYAGKLAGDDERLFTYGWVGTKGRNTDTGSLGWGGNLVGHELYQKENGELGIKMIEDVKNDISHRYPHKTLDTQEIVTKLTFDQTGYHSTLYEPFKANRFARLSFDYTQKSKTGYAGLMFNTTSAEEAGKTGYIFDSQRNMVSFYNNIQSKTDFGEPDYEVPFTFKNGEKIHIDFLYENEAATMYINGQVALTERVYSLKGKAFSVFAKDKKCEFENFKFYE